MSSKCRVAAVQMVSGSSIEENLQQAQHLLEHAKQQGCQLALLPENFALMGAQNIVQNAESLDEPGPILLFLAQMSRSLGMWIVAGSAPFKDDRDGRPASKGRVFPSCSVWDANGICFNRYDKMHLFDVDVADGVGRYRESDQYIAGHEAVCAATPWAPLGLSICYDLRFPELYRVLGNMGAQILTVPAAFTYHTGQAHWETLLRARAIENQCYIVAANQGGQHGGKRETWGHSCIIDPWGEVLECIDEPGSGVVCADLELSRLNEVRRTMPALQHRRL